MGTESNMLVIDAGNTSVKVAQFKGDNLVSVTPYALEEMKVKFGNDTKTTTVISSVLSAEKTAQIVELFENSTLITSSTSLPLNLEYTTKNTLGIDRVCNAVFAATASTTIHALVIDIGTCVKFDLIHKEKGYLGGSISPGIDLRYKSLNDYTGNLPLLSDKASLPLLGTNTNTSIQSGVINGLKGELLEFMSQYKSEFDDLTFFVTGGDARYFDLDAKNDIFADRNLTIKGLYEIYKFNA
jgi:type III pantothenate kinase